MLRKLPPEVAAGVLGGAMLAGGLLLASCGQEQEEAKPPVSAVTAQATPSPGSAPVAAAPALAVRTPVEAKSGDEETLPPDVEVVPVDTLVTPGQPLEVVVRTTSDVTRLALSDGRDEPLAFVREQGSDRWKVTYRVPLKSHVERWGVSITARTDAGRWRRVWIFLHARDGTESAREEASAPSDTTKEVTP